MEKSKVVIPSETYKQLDENGFVRINVQSDQKNTKQQTSNNDGTVPSIKALLIKNDYKGTRKLFKKIIDLLEINTLNITTVYSKQEIIAQIVNECYEENNIRD